MSDVTKPSECCPECEHAVAKTVESMQQGARRTVFDAEITFEVAGKVGDVIHHEVESIYDFRITKKMSTDTAAQKGEGTRVRAFWIDGKSQMPAGVAPLAAAFSDSPLGCGVAFDICRAGMKIGLEIEFLTDCAFHAVFLGKAAKDGGAS